MLSAKIDSGQIRAMKGRERIPALTAYDFAMARLLDQAGVPFVLVGDSLGMVVLGYPDTTHVTMDHMLHHVRAVARAQPAGLVVADLPYRSYETLESAVTNARLLREAGAEAVKAEGGKAIAPQVRAIVAEGIPVCGHLGMLPQHIREEGRYRVKGKDPNSQAELLSDADAITSAGAFALVLELVAPPVAEAITRRVPIPTIGIGSGEACDGQILVTTDLLGTSPDFIPRHVNPQILHRELMLTRLRSWCQDVRGGSTRP